MITSLPDGTITPALVVDLDTVERNVLQMARACRDRGIRLRPHAKTHKCIELAQLQLQAGASGLTVATIGEAEYFAEGGCTDLFIAYPLWAGEEAGRRLRALAERVAVSVGFDSAEGAARLASVIGTASEKIKAVLEIDCGHHRTGVEPAEAASAAMAAAAAGLSVHGIFTFPGHSYGVDARNGAVRDEERALALAAEVLSAAGLPPQVISGGSTPTALLSRAGTLNELRPGSYVFNDATQVALGSCALQDVGLVGAATVVSVPDAGRFVLDTGSKILGADRPPSVSGYGLLPEFPEATIVSLSEHHGVVHLPPGATAPVAGSRLAVVPNHVCNAVNLADELLVARGAEVVARWAVAPRSVNRG